MKPNIFILGGSPLQKDLLDSAKKRYTTYVIDGNEHCALAQQADYFIHLDFSDTEKLYQAALDKQPKLILTMASEPANLSAAIVSEKMGLPYNPVKTVKKTLNKLAMKECCEHNQIHTAKLQLAFDKIPDENSLENLIFPCIIKPAQSSAGRGVFKADNKHQLLSAIPDALQYSNNGFAMIETLLSGTQYSVETISSHGKHHIIGITREFLGEPPYFAETQQYFPAILTIQQKANIETFVHQVLNAFHIEVGACHIEVRIDDSDQVTLIEIASRIGGWRSELIERAYGIRFTELLLDAHNGTLQFPTISQTDTYAVVKMIFNQANFEYYQVLKQDKRFVVSPITWLKETISEKKNSLMDSSGYYFLTVLKQEDLEDALH